MLQSYFLITLRNLSKHKAYSLLNIAGLAVGITCFLEIGVRKAVGASVMNVVVLVVREFIVLVALAILVAWPLAYFAMNRWLGNFAYCADLQWQTFLLAGALAIFIALLTISYQSIRAALTNPADALRYE